MTADHIAPDILTAAAERLQARITAGKPAELGTPADLAALADFFGLGLDDWRGGAGKFRDVNIGTGGTLHALQGFAAACQRAGIMCRVQQVNTPDHPDFGKLYAEVGSFWWG